MTTPLGPQITVAVNALRAEARIWDDESDALAQLGSKAAGLRLTRIEAGLFQLVVDAYEQVIDQVTARSAEGRERLAQVGVTLRSIADTYEQEEAANEHRLRHLF